MENIKLGKYADILTDRVFRRSFGTEEWKRLTELLLQLLIPERKINSISFSPTEHINAFNRSKDVRIDVECTDTDGSRFMVEMQLAPQRDFYARAIFNSSFGIQEQISFGERNYLYKPVYFIGIMNFCFHKDSDRVVFRYRLREDDSGELMSENLQYIFVELPNCAKTPHEAESLAERVFYSMRNMSTLERIPHGWDEEEIIKLLFDSVKLSNFTPKDKADYIEDMTTKQDIENQIAYAAEQGLRIGMEKGMKKGMEKGMEKGVAMVAKKLLEQGIPESEILMATGLTAEGLRALN